MEWDKKPKIQNQDTNMFIKLGSGLISPKFLNWPVFAAGEV